MTMLWNAEVSVDGITKASMGGSTASEVIAKCIRDAIYYQAIYPQSKVLIASIEARCFQCSGVGTISKSMAYCKTKEIKCPNCKGRIEVQSMPNIPFNMPDSANRITLVQQ